MTVYVRLFHDVVTFTFLPAFASPQTGALVFCCNTMLSVNSGNIFIFACVADAPRRSNADTKSVFVCIMVLFLSINCLVVGKPFCEAEEHPLPQRCSKLHIKNFSVIANLKKIVET